MRNKSRKIQTFVMNKEGLRFSWNIIDISNENIVVVPLIEVVPHQSKMLPLIHCLCIRVLIFFPQFPTLPSQYLPQHFETTFSISKDIECLNDFKAGFCGGVSGRLRMNCNCYIIYYIFKWWFLVLLLLA